MEPTGFGNSHSHSNAGGMTSSISSEDILSQSNHPNSRRSPFQALKHTNGSNHINGLSFSISHSTNGHSSSPTLNGHSSLNSSGVHAQTPEIRVKSPHQFKPYRSSSPCVFCGENIGQVWIPFTSHSYKCSQCGIVCHKKCMDLMNTISCSNTIQKKIVPSSGKNRSPSMMGTSQSAPALSVATMAVSASPTLLTNSNSSPSCTSSAASTPLSGSSGDLMKPPTPTSTSTPSESTAFVKSMGNTTITGAMPADERIIDSMFEALAKERGLPEKMNWTKERKWLLITQHGQLHQEHSPESNGNASSDSNHSNGTPEYFINALRNEPSKELMLSLLVQLRSKTFSWLTSFIEMDGITLIFNLLQSKKKETREECIRAIATFMNSTHGLKSVTSLPFAAKRLAMVLTSQQFTLKSRAIVIELLTVMCMEKWVPGGYSMVLKALTNLKEKKRFTNFVKFIKENSSLEMKTKALCFINVLIHEPEETSVRVNIRGEFLRLGLYDYLKPLKPTLSPDENLYLQIEIFEDMMMEDNQELDHKLEELKKKLGVDIENLDALFKALKSSASKSGLTKSLLSVMQNLLVLHSDSDGIKYWLLIDQLVRQISMQRNSLDGNDTIDMKSLLQNVDAQTKEVTLTRKMEELEKQNIDKAAIIQEKDMSIKQLLDLVKQIKLAGGDVSPALQKQIEEAIKNLDVPAAVVVVPTETIEITPPPPPPPISTNIPTTPEPAVDAPPPPPPPPMLGGGGGPPPPPPPPMGGKKNPAAIKTRPPPKVPKPAHPLKALQWTKMPPAKLNESVFDKLGEMNDIHLPWKTIEQEFAAKVIVRKEKPLRKLGPMQVIDAKLGQNISIFLSQFKTVPVRELIDAVQKQDEARLSKEQIRQMAKLLPSKDDMAALSDFLKVEDRSKLAAADQFCIDVGNFSFMGDKLALFQLRAEFQQRASELRPEIAAVSLACNELLKSNNLKRLFEIVLVLGNFINYGTVRGDQSGYKVDCMIKLADTKSADLQSNLIHTLVEYCEEKEPSLLAFADELPSLDVAKRVVWSGVVADLSMLSREFSLCKSIVDQFQKSNEPFCETMVPFLELAAIELDKLKKLQANTEESFKKLCIYLGEDSTKITPDEIFELFSRFATLFEAGLLLLQQIREQQEKDSKREQQKLLRAELKLKLAGKIQANNPQKKDDQDEDIVNDLLLAVRDGDVFRKGRRKVVLNRADSNHLSQLSPAK